jgi:tetratricopeptide (TPR) repeat protein
MAGTLAQYRIFIASPGGLETERRAFRDVIQKYNETDANPRGVHFTPVGWEIILGGVGRPQELINEDVRQCDYFLLMLQNRWGSRTGTDDDPKYKSGTEEEYHVAWECFDDPHKPLRQIVVAFKGVGAEQLADPGEQLKPVLDFKQKLEREKRLLYDGFDDLASFEHLVRQHIAKWLFDHEQNRTTKVTEPEPLPGSSADRTAETISVPEADVSETETSEELAEAERLADQGQLVEAETIFAQAITKGTNPDAFNRYGHFLQRVGRLAQSEVMYQRVIELGKAAGSEEWQAKGYGTIGLIYKTRGELDRAEEMHKKSLEISEGLGRQEGMAAQYGNLGLIYRRRGELDRAEDMHNKSLEIEKRLGHQEGVAADYSNLGAIAEKRGETAIARDFWTKARDLYRKMGIAHEAEETQKWLDDLPS